MSKVVSLRLRDEQVERLRRAARRFGRTPSEAAAILLEEALRQAEFALIEFRDSPAGRQAYLKGSRLAVWQIVSFLRAVEGDQARTASSLETPMSWVQAAVAYASAYPDEIDAAILDNAPDPARLSRLIPGLEIVTVDAPPA
ncbi:MAG: transcriptional regulator [Chloroflexi bacterium]|nr:transcriptional regulator [Chloroflexota bacterium]